MDQEVKYIDIKDLVLWTENPRDPINANAKDQDIVEKAFEDRLGKWTLAKLSKEMGDYYDLSELPTVVYHGEKPVIYDGNRRMILGKIKYGLVTPPNGIAIEIPDFPEKIPCNVCKEKIALKNVFRKHSDSGSWLPLERDIFLHKFMGKGKSIFLSLEEETGLVSSNPHLNQRFVKDEVFKAETLKAMGFAIENGQLRSVHSDQEGYSLFSDLSKKIEQQVITTRKQRGKTLEVLDPSSRKLIDQNKNNKFRSCKIKFSQPLDIQKKIQTKRTTKKKTEIFGGKLYLNSGEISDLYRDISDLYNKFYLKEKNSLSQTFPCLIRMSLRLLCEAAANDANNMKLDGYVNKYFQEAKENLNQDIKTTLSNQNVTDKSIIQLLHTGAHNYSSSSNIEQTVAMSIIIGAMLTISHGKEE